MPSAQLSNPLHLASPSRLLQQYAGLIQRVTRQLNARLGLHRDMDESWSAGALGLLEAAKRFDPNRPVKFESFAEHRIRGAILDELRRMDHLPRRLRTRTSKLARAKQDLEHGLGRDATPDELAEAAGMDLAELGAIQQLAQPHLPLTPDLVRGAPVSGPEEEASNKQLVEALSNAISSLPPRLQTLLSLHYVEDLTYREISELLGVSEPRVCQLHAEAIRKLRLNRRIEQCAEDGPVVSRRGRQS
jgi:RNA polymerase sigma factor for flagellar operon FliA